MPFYFLALLLFTTAAADTYNTFRGNPQLTGVATSNLAPPLTLLWAYPTQDAIESTAAIHEGTVYVGSLDGQLYALDLRTGDASMAVPSRRRNQVLPHRRRQHHLLRRRSRHLPRRRHPKRSAPLDFRRRRQHHLLGQLRRRPPLLRQLRPAPVLPRRNHRNPDLENRHRGIYSQYAGTV